MNTKSVLLGCFLFSASFISHAADTYTLQGPLSGFYTGTSSSCYIAINDSSDGFYKNQWHFISGDTGSAMCALARMAYFTLTPVNASVKVETSSSDTANTVTNLQVTNTSVTWPPYHNK